MWEQHSDSEVCPCMVMQKLFGSTCFSCYNIRESQVPAWLWQDLQGVCFLQKYRHENNLSWWIWSVWPSTWNSQNPSPPSPSYPQFFFVLAQPPWPSLCALCAESGPVNSSSAVLPERMWLGLGVGGQGGTGAGFIGSTLVSSQLASTILVPESLIPTGWLQIMRMCASV